MSPLRIVAEPLTAEAFWPFGQVLELPAAAGRVDYSGFLENGRPGVPVCFRTSLTPAKALPLRTRVMERHRFSSQAFLPLDAGRYLVLVAPGSAEDRPDPAGLRAFLCEPRQGINYRAGAWHHPMTALDRPALFATVMFADGGPDDEEFVDLPVEVAVHAG